MTCAPNRWRKVRIGPVGEWGKHGGGLSYVSGAPCQGGSEVLGDLLELLDHRLSFASGRFHRLLQAMVDVVADERLLRLAHGALDGVKLLGEVEAGASGLDHLDDPAQVVVGALQALDDLGMG
jgi:hypothetical protein